MITERGRSELERGASWPAVRSGLMLVAVTWILSTLSSAGVQLAAFSLTARAAAGDPVAIGWLGVSSLVHQGVYSLFALLIVVGAVKLTRVPPATGAVSPALVAAASFVIVLLLNVILLFTERVPEPIRATPEAAVRQLWGVLTVARAVGVFALLVALWRTARALAVARPPALIGAAFAAAAIDTGYPVWRALAAAPAQALRSTTERSLLIAVQLVLAVLLVDLALAARRAARKELELADGRESGPPSDEAESEPASDEAEREPTSDEAESEPGSDEAEPEPASDARDSEPTRDEPERESDAPPSARPSGASEPSLGVVWAAAILAAVAVALLPLWDAISSTSSLRALTDAVAGAPGVEQPTLPLLYGAGATGVALLISRLLRTAPYAARVVLAIAALVSLHYASTTAHQVATSRSSLVDGWIVCETGLDVHGNLVSSDLAYHGPYDGPRSASGEPCVLAAERRDRHMELEPRGGFRDGIIQIGTRFPEERKRVLWGTLATVLALATSALLLVRVTREPTRREPTRPKLTRPKPARPKPKRPKPARPKPARPKPPEPRSQGRRRRR